jgi:retron-type reverse transcriptase
MIDATIPTNSFACRKGMGNRNAVLSLAAELRRLGTQRYTIKLDVRRYFESIPHAQLLGRLEEIFGDRDFLGLLKGLLDSHEPFHRRGAGIPIGNVSSPIITVMGHGRFQGTKTCDLGDPREF